MVKIKVYAVNNIVGKIIGLIGKNKPQAIYLKTRFGIHTFGLKFPIDVVLLDDSYIVRKIMENLHPNKLLFWNPKYFNVLELPAGTVKRKKINTLQKLTIKFLKVI